MTTAFYIYSNVRLKEISILNSFEQIQHTCDNFMMTMREICFSDEGDWGLNEGDFLKTCSSCFSYHFLIIFIWFRCTKELELRNLNDRNIHFQVLISK